jgi:exopolysaccharide biosynthesis WecB/TagA/CpsF family protein
MARLFNLLRGDLALAGPRLRARGEKPDLAGAEMATRLAARPGLVSPFTLRRRVGIAHQAESEIDSEFVHTGTARGDLTLLLRSGLSRVLVGSSDRPAPALLKFFQIEMSNTTMAEAVAWMTSRCSRRQVTQVAFVNPDCLNLSLRDKAYAAVLQNVEQVLPDGIGIKIGCRLKGVAMRDNLNGTDLFPILCEAAAQQGLSVFLLGAKPGIAEATATNMQVRFPALDIAGTHHGYIEAADEPGVIETINRSGADILLVAMGAPRQELLLARWKHQLQAPLRMGVGGLFDYYSGSIPRAPIWMREIGMEWVWRLIQEPGRMWRRYVIGNPAFIYRVWRESADESAALVRLPRGLRGILPMRSITGIAAYVRRLSWQLYLRLSHFTKRVLDIVVSALLLFLLAPPLALVALAICIESRGPVFFRQIRVGQWGKTFPMWKFRSMRVAAEAQQQLLADQNQMDGGVIFKMKQDPRVTKVGRIIRRLSIDELPQLWNVFCGDMSLVGPRPSLPSEVNLYSVEDRGRLEAKPGITCIWQVTGRSDIPFDQQVDLDIEYIQTQSVRNDVALLVKTVPAVLSGRGAY